MTYDDEVWRGANYQDQGWEGGNKGDKRAKSKDYRV